MTRKDLERLIQKGLLWLKDDTARWEVHYAFFAKSFGQLNLDESEKDTVHLFTP